MAKRKEKLEGSSEEAAPDSGANVLDLGQFSDRFLRSRVTRLILPAATRLLVNSTYDVVDNYGEVVGSLEVLGAGKMDIRDANEADAHHSGHGSLLALLSWYWHENGTGDEFRAARLEGQSHSRVTQPIRDWMAAQTKKKCEAGVYEVRFSPPERPEPLARPVVSG